MNKPLDLELVNALKLVHERLNWVLQKKASDGTWVTIEENLHGREAAYARLHELKGEGHLRALPKNEAEKYAEGFSQGLRTAADPEQAVRTQKAVKTERRKRRRHHGQMYMPWNL